MMKAGPFKAHDPTSKPPIGPKRLQGECKWGRRATSISYDSRRLDERGLPGQAGLWSGRSSTRRLRDLRGA